MWWSTYMKVVVQWFPMLWFVSNGCDEIVGDITSSLKPETGEAKEAKISKLRALYLIYWTNHKIPSKFPLSSPMYLTTCWDNSLEDINFKVQPLVFSSCWIFLNNCCKFQNINLAEFVGHVFENTSEAGINKYCSEQMNFQLWEYKCSEFNVLQIDLFVPEMSEKTKTGGYLQDYVTSVPALN
jgi:hypothetical protein